MNRTATALLLALGLAACQKSPSAKPAAASLALHDDVGNTGPLAFATLSRILIDSSFPASPGPHAVRIDVTGPNGGLYGTVRGQAQAGPEGVATLSQWLEVAGTTIDHYHMVGTWQFALSVDDGPLLASASIDVTD
jgi:hypothetical protein